MVDFPSRQKLYDSNTKFFGLDQALGVIWHLSSVISMAQKSYPVTYAINQGFQLAKMFQLKKILEFLSHFSQINLPMTMLTKVRVNINGWRLVHLVDVRLVFSPTKMGWVWGTLPSLVLPLTQNMKNSEKEKA